MPEMERPPKAARAICWRASRGKSRAGMVGAWTGVRIHMPGTPDGRGRVTTSTYGVPGSFTTPEILYFPFRLLPGIEPGRTSGMVQTVSGAGNTFWQASRERKRPEYSRSYLHSLRSLTSSFKKEGKEWDTDWTDEADSHGSYQRINSSNPY